MTIAPTIMWFRQDLRLADNPALNEACASTGPVVAVYILDDTSPGQWKMGGASQWWLHHSLLSLAQSLEARGSRLILRRGPAADTLKSLCAETGADRVVISRSYEPWARKLETQIYDDLAAEGVMLQRYAGSLLFDPDFVRTKTGVAYKVYSPFWRAVSATEVRTPIAAPTMIPEPAKMPTGDRLQDWKLLPTRPDWAHGLRQTWTPGEPAAQASLDKFLDDGIARYNSDRNRPDLPGTSRLSPHLHFGEISPALCWYRARKFASGKG